jgi:hypothetical protein
LVAESWFSGQVAARESDYRLEELSGAVDECNGGVGSPADLCGELGQPIEGRLWRGIENLVRAKSRQPVRIVQRGDVLCHADLSRQYRPRSSSVLGNGRSEAASLAPDWKGLQLMANRQRVVALERTIRLLANR